MTDLDLGTHRRISIPEIFRFRELFYDDYHSAASDRSRKVLAVNIPGESVKLSKLHPYIAFMDGHVLQLAGGLYCTLDIRSRSRGGWS